MKRFLIGQLSANGDCLYATILARQIKHDHPDSHLTWAVSSLCQGVVRNNPDVDEIWEIPVSDLQMQEQAWYLFEQEAYRQMEHGQFDRSFLSQIWPANFQRYDGTVRPSILRTYEAPITVPIRPVLALTEEDQQQVEAFVKQTAIENYSHRILFECASNSGQSYVTPQFALEVARLVMQEQIDSCFILSSAQPVVSDDARIVSGNVLSLRQNAALSKFCSLLVGCASGVTVATTSTAAVQLPMIQLLKGGKSVYASFAHDHAYWGLSQDQIIELTDAAPEHVARCILETCRDGFAAVRPKYHVRIPVEFDYYWGVINGQLMQRCRYLDAANALSITANRYGWTPKLLSLARDRVAWMLPSDPRYAYPHRRRQAEQFLETIWSIRP